MTVDVDSSSAQQQQQQQQQQQPPVLEGVPVIDASGFLAQASQDIPPPQEVIDQVREAATSWGFFQLVNHGVSQQLLDDHDEAQRSFFALPLEAKAAVKRSADNAMGFFNDELTKQKVDLKEGFDFRHVQYPELPGDHPQNQDPQGVNRWPQGQPEFRVINERYFSEMTRVAFRLLEVLSLGLGLPAKALHAFFEPSHTSFLRLNYYPVLPSAPPDSLGISPHKDAGFLTVLVQDSVAGLQVQRGGAWHTVQPLPGAFTINVGDMAQVLSNDAWYASNHRVLQSRGPERYSRAYFFNPAASAVIAPRTDLEGADTVPHYRPISWQDFRLKRIAGDYADVGEEVQIEHYRLDTNQQQQQQK